MLVTPPVTPMSYCFGEFVDTICRSIYSTHAKEQAGRCTNNRSKHDVKIESAVVLVHIGTGRGCNAAASHDCVSVRIRSGTQP